jgi:iron complex transport system permease protein
LENCKSQKDKFLLVIMGYCFVYICSAFLSISFGSVKISFDDDLFLKMIQIRFLNFMQASFVGAILALSGFVLQKIFKNPLADPFFLGLSSGGACFAAAFLLLSSGSFLSDVSIFYYFSVQSIFAFLGCLFSFLIVVFARKKIAHMHDEYVYPVIGIIINSFFSSLILFMFSIANPDKFAEMHHYLIGALQPSSFLQILFIFLASLIPLVVILKISKFYDFLVFGDDFSFSNGINPLKVRSLSVFMICFLISIVVSVSGIIGFIGLIVPHIVNRMHRYSSQFQGILSMILGAIFLVNADTLSRTLFPPTQISVGVFTSIIGAPILSVIILSRKKL